MTSAHNLAPLPASFENSIKLYKGAWAQYERARQGVVAEAQHPDNFTASGKLTGRGLKVIRRLFALGLDDSDIAELMDMNQSSVYRRRMHWMISKA